jgi:hypothetical protein
MTHSGSHEGKALDEREADERGWIVRSECDLRVGGVWTVEFGPKAAWPPGSVNESNHRFRCGVDQALKSQLVGHGSPAVRAST